MCLKPSHAFMFVRCLFLRASVVKFIDHGHRASGTPMGEGRPSSSHQRRSKARSGGSSSSSRANPHKRKSLVLYDTDFQLISPRHTSIIHLNPKLKHPAFIPSVTSSFCAQRALDSGQPVWSGLAHDPTAFCYALDAIAGA